VTKDDVLARMNNQWDDRKKIELSDFVVNNIELDDTKKQILKLHKKLSKIRKIRNNS